MDKIPTTARAAKLLLCMAIVAMIAANGNESAFAQAGPSAATEPVKTTAEQAAEQQVALSAERIIELLQQEPGLLLEVKKVLVRKAYEQGRILDPDDLTDEAVYQLLRENQSICVLATQEIEDRGYVKLNATREESERQLDQQSEFNQQLQISRATSAPPAQANVPQLNPRFSQPQVETPQSRREVTPVQAPERELEMTSVPQSDDFFEGMGIDRNSNLAPGGQNRITPEQLPALLNASSSVPASQTVMTSAQAPFGMSPALSYATPGNAAFPRATPQYQTQPDFDTLNQTDTLRANLEPSHPEIPSAEDLNLDRPQIQRQANPYANIPSLYDLYAQVSPRPAQLERFGLAIFRNGSGNVDKLPMDLPAGPDYVLGPGDGVSIDIWGGVAERLQRSIDPSGRVALPEVGTIEVAGRTLGDVQRLVQAALRTQYHDVEADVSLARIRSVRVYVVGEVENPGPYDISSLSTPLNALYAAGGPTSRGSLRHLRLYRGNELIQEVDAYDLLLHGVHGNLARIQSGDTIQVPPMGPEITVEGMVMHPAIYELSAETSLAQALELAGGVLTTGTYRHIEVERIVAHQSHTMLQLDLPEANDAQSVNQALADFKVQDGDRIRISPIVPYAEKTVYLDGHVFRPGKYAYHQGMKVTDLVHSYNDLLPEPSRRHAEIIRLKAPDYTPEVLAFNLGDALAGKDQDLALEPFDTVRIFGRYDFEDPPTITVTGEVRDPGDHVTNGATRLRDAIYLADGTTPDAEMNNAQIFRRMPDGDLKVISVNLRRALADDPKDNILLEPKDRIIIHRNLNKLDPPTVVIAGEVARPGRYPLGEDMTAAQLVRVAGGFKRGAYTDSADLTRYATVPGKGVTGEIVNVPIAQAMAGVPDTDVRLHDGDVFTIKQIAGWNDVGASIAVKGEVIHPGTYGIKEGERLSSILMRAGGFRDDAFPYGVIFERKQVRDLEEENREQLIRQVRTDGADLTQIPEQDTDQKMAKEAAVNQWQAALQKLQASPPSGRLVIHISKDIKRWANTAADLQVRAGDVIFIPKRSNFVMVEGSVYNPTAVTYKPGKDAAWYLKQAGGPTNTANKKAVFVIRADGSVVGGSGGLFTGGIGHEALYPGDLVMVPEKAFSGTTKWKQTLESAQLAYAVGIAIQVARSF